MEIKGKLPCKFGSNCYRKNFKHFELYFHPEEFYKFKKNNESDLKKPNKLKMKRKDAVLDVNKTLKKTCKPKIKSGNFFKSCEKSNDFLGIPETNSNDVESNPNTCWVSDQNKSSDKKSSLDSEFKNKTARERIKMLCLVDMPSDFYSFYEFYMSVSEKYNLKDFHLGDLKLVGPFDILSGKMNHIANTELFLCHWRFYYDPPEFQTVLAAGSGFHIGYWRDDPKENPIFLASNDPNKDCIFKVEAENLFGTVHHYLSEFINTCDPCKKMELIKVQIALNDWAEKKNFPLQRISSKMKLRQKKIASNTFHGAGIVVPIDSKTKIGYRPLIETDANIKKICKLIVKASNENDRDSFWENLQPLINAANIANDECDFGNSLELGIDLFCLGSPLFHETVGHLLSTAYSLLNRPEFEKIIKNHLKFRRSGNNMSINNLRIDGNFF